jgi:sec-independent protein translocase protein TatA
MGAMSPWHWAIIAVVLVLLFGARRLPESARSLGKSMRIFRSELTELRSDDARSSSPAEAASDLKEGMTS